MAKCIAIDKSCRLRFLFVPVAQLHRKVDTLSESQSNAQSHPGEEPDLVRLQLAVL